MRKIKKNKSSNYMLIGITYVIMILAISTAYSFLNENLSITATTSISQHGDDYILNNNIVSKEEIDGVYYYEYNVVLTYTGANTTTGWESYIQIPFDSEIIECYNAASCVVEGEALTVTNDITNGTLSPDNTSATYTFKFKTSEANYSLNTLGVKFFINGQTNPDNPDNPDDPPAEVIPTTKDVNGVLSLLYDWNASKQYLLTIKNTSDTYRISSYIVTIKVPDGFMVNTAWSAEWKFDEATGILTIEGPLWDPGIAPGANIEINIQFTTPTSEHPYIIDFIGIDENGNQVRVSTTESGA